MTKAQKSQRHDEWTEIVEQTLKDNPKLREALEVFRISHDAYAKALANMMSYQTTMTTTTTNPPRSKCARNR